MGNHRHVAAGVIVREGRVLACRRGAHKKLPFQWEFPGGKLEDGETVEQALVRELREELELEVRAVRELHSETTDYGEAGHFTVHFVMAEPVGSGQPVNTEFSAMGWFLPEELFSLDFLEGNRAALEIIRKEVG